SRHHCRRHRLAAGLDQRELHGRRQLGGVADGGREGDGHDERDAHGSPPHGTIRKAWLVPLPCASAFVQATTFTTAWSLGAPATVQRSFRSPVPVASSSENVAPSRASHTSNPDSPAMPPFNFGFHPILSTLPTRAFFFV